MQLSAFVNRFDCYVFFSSYLVHYIMVQVLSGSAVMSLKIKTSFKPHIDIMTTALRDTSHCRPKITKFAKPLLIRNN